jgi:hypothetical protein
MGLVISILAGIVGVAGGWALAAFLTIAVGALSGIRDQDGGFAMMAFFAIGPAGGLIGLLVAVWLVRLRRGKRGAAAFLGESAMVAVAIAALGAAVAGAIWAVRPHVATNGLPPELVFEIRLPEGVAPPPPVSRSEALARRSPIELVSGDYAMAAEIGEARSEAEGVIVSGRVEMAIRDRERLLVLKGVDREIVFEIRLARVPDHADLFGEWQAPLAVNGIPGGQAEEGYRIRYRAEWR